MIQVNVELAERSYPIYIGTSELESMIQKTSVAIPDWTHSVVMVDATLAEFANKNIVSLFQAAGKRTTLLTIPSGESSKSIGMLAELWSGMVQAKADRKSVVVAVGGGVVGDLAGFAAASYTRGLRFVQIPTTLLAMVDSSVGGKTGVNLPEAKNMIGAFWQPHAVCIDTSTLHSLPDREYWSGLAEVVKYGVILDESFFAYLESNASAIVKRTPSAVEHIVKRSCELKAHVVSQDERETTGLRAILNYGHTFGHAIEACTSYGRYLHGEAIAIGMTMAANLATRMQLWPALCAERQLSLLKQLNLPTQFSGVPSEQLIAAMQLDKKTEHGKLNFILPKMIGKVEQVRNCNHDDILASIASARID
jgi:3-dehydroquinate synthase